MTTTAAEHLRAWAFDDLVREGLSLIPAVAPGWTNHNPSDPGITLVELLAYFAEALAYRLGRVTPQAKLQFLRLLMDGHWRGWKDLKERGDIERALDAAVRDLTQADCAVAAEDYERLAIESALRHLPQGGPVRAFCVPGTANKRAHVTVVLLPKREIEAGDLERLCAAVREDLLGSCLLTTRLHVIGPIHVHAAIGCRIALRPGARAEQVLDAIDADFEARIGPWGDDQAAPGTPVTLDRIVELIDRTAGVDFVEDVTVTHMSQRGGEVFDLSSRVGIIVARHATVGVDSRLGVQSRLGRHRLIADSAGRFGAIGLMPGELLHLRLAREAVQVSGVSR